MELNKQELAKSLEYIRKRYGEGALVRLGDKPRKGIEVIPTGIFSIDEILGIGGFPKGRVVEIYGQEAGGKSTLALHLTAEAQNQGGLVAYIDMEHALSPTYAEKLGVNIDDLFVSQPESGDQALEITENLARSGQFSLIVIDSVAALTPQAEINGEIGDSLPGLQARLMSQACRKITPVASSTNTCVVFINQLREKIGVTWGSPEITSGGKALKFYASMRLDVRRIGAVKSGEQIVGNRTKIKVVKNRLAPPFKEVEIDLIYGQGFAKNNDLLEQAIKHEVIQQKGAWFSYKDEKFQGKDNLKVKMNDTEFYNEILLKVKECIYKQSATSNEI